jgi:hypothetical protein
MLVDLHGNRHKMYDSSNSGCRTSLPEQGDLQARCEHLSWSSNLPVWHANYQDKFPRYLHGKRRKLFPGPHWGEVLTLYGLILYQLDFHQDGR